MGVDPSAFYAAQARLNRNKLRESPAEIEPDKGSEADLHEKIIAECQRRVWVCIHSRMDRRSTNQCGTPDFIIFTNFYSLTDTHCHCPLVLCIECKTRTGKLSPAQQAMKCHLEKLGHKYHVVRSFQEFLQVIQ